MWTWLETTTVALTVRDSLFWTSFLSGLHLVGMTIAAGASMVVGLRLSGLALRTYAAGDVVSAAARAVPWGLALSICTGALLFAPRAESAVENELFRWKMLMLAVAVLFHLVFVRRAVRQTAAGAADSLVGGLGMLLWLSVVSLGAAYILLE